eukprot:NODE_196_length_2202_cov_51.530887_g167_i0.p1 GENE.NODE_196_length_2202_cov_51.530887_g167_i0~~NODE_196_length_2202_cov_51.530887_g167_i0.p1  ORF type:complete len:390 (-),score=119.62 NODE_196_length_2202_cov_51.530887_g167_i0:125-1294(-)
MFALLCKKKALDQCVRPSHRAASKRLPGLASQMQCQELQYGVLAFAKYATIMNRGIVYKNWSEIQGAEPGINAAIQQMAQGELECEKEEPKCAQGMREGMAVVLAGQRVMEAGIKAMDIGMTYNGTFSEAEGTDDLVQALDRCVPPGAAVKASMAWQMKCQMLQYGVLSFANYATIMNRGIVYKNWSEIQGAEPGINAAIQQMAQGEKECEVEEPKCAQGMRDGMEMVTAGQRVMEVGIKAMDLNMTYNGMLKEAQGMDKTVQALDVCVPPTTTSGRRCVDAVVDGAWMVVNYGSKMSLGVVGANWEVLRVAGMGLDKGIGAMVQGVGACEADGRRCGSELQEGLTQVLSAQPGLRSSIRSRDLGAVGLALGKVASGGDVILKATFHCS